MKCFSLSILLIVFSFAAFGQKENIKSSCKVLLPAISDSYEGECKKGLAHGEGVAKGVDEYNGEFIKGYPDGKGTYTWAVGNIYEGNWKKGKQYGYGKMTLKLLHGDSLVEGYWKDNKYVGKTFRKYDYKVIEVRDIENVDIMRTDPNGTEVRIMFQKMGMRNYDLQDLFMTSDSGYESSMFSGFEDVEFPVRVSVSYTTQSRTGTATRNCRVTFEIYEPGLWEVQLEN